ncbi:hypothetical protein E2553_35115 [Paraburkholderia dipogonis]|uniref:Uncharacterized protein n=1 Tax=Paraburkholderia dipogonis TaxID=1211383 RepID=A0A4Y8MX31_9BURK|nr:hypothetical protein [Paraburkholderia dipogonis]TFE41873.1 hypothetical protein E2553_35115 [Paraburkholderia dipogonis]
MNSVAKSTITTLSLGQDDLNRELADLIFEDCHHAGEPSSYRTNTRDIFVRSELMTGELCVVVPLPGMLSTEIPPTTESPSAVVLRERNDGKGDAYLRMRGGNVSLQSDELRGDRYLVLYLFDDNASLDLIPVTEELREEIWVHEMSAQSRHFFDDEPLEETAQGPFDVPLVARRAITVTPHETKSTAIPELG